MKKLEAVLAISAISAVVMMGQVKDEIVRSTAIYGSVVISTPTIVLTAALIALAVATLGVWLYQTRPKHN